MSRRTRLIAPEDPLPQRGKHFVQSLRFQRFNQIIDYPIADGLLRILKISMAADDYHPDLRKFHLQNPGQFQTVHDRHINVAKNHLGLQKPDQFQRFPTVFGFADYLKSYRRGFRAF